MKKFVIYGIVTVSAWLTLTMCSDSIVNKMAFYPEKGSAIDISQLPPLIEHHIVKTPDGEELSTFYFRNQNADKTILYFHGNAGNATQRIPLAMDLAKLNSNVFLIDYRGYGLSSGSPSEKGLYIDAKASLDYMIKDLGVDTSSLFVYGRSIGSAVAVDLAESFPFKGMILATPISSGRDVATMAGVGSSVSVIGDPFNNVEKITSYEGPLLIIHGEKDEVLPIEMGESLRDVAVSPVRLVVIPGAGHNDITQIDGNTFYGEIQRFCSEVMSGSFNGSNLVPNKGLERTHTKVVQNEK